MPPGTQTTVREAAFAVFAHWGVDRLFGNPGSTELPLLRGLPFPYVQGLNEAVVLGMADGYARASGRAALVNLHSAAGTGHAMGNLFTAWKNNAPVVVTAGQQARPILPFDPFLFAERATEFPRPYVKWSAEPARAEDVPLALARAFAVALTPPMGPVFVSIPVDDWDRSCTMPALPSLVTRTAADPAALAPLATMLAEARNPALVLGTGIANAGGWDAAIALAEASGAAAWVAPYAAREVFPEDHLNFAGFLPAWRDRLSALLQPHDAILVVGAPVFTWHVEGSGPFWPPAATLALLSDDPQHLAALPGGQGVLGDPALGLSALANLLQPQRRHLRAARRVDPPAPAMAPDHVMSRIAALRPADAMIVEEAPTARGAMHDHLPITRSSGFYTCASGGLGHGLPAAIGVALAQSARVIALLGDGSAMYAIQGLYAARNERAAVSFVILNNGGYAALTGFAGEFGLNHVPGCDLSGIDFVQLAQAQGVPGRRVERVDQLDEALDWSFAETGPTLLDLRLA
ncbi:benzoylformate decarboxylase [Croceibacterium sp. TMG7-5b_MA50]|uniref:benzoylformate decarboxylase n=1 Tax=Croceibacterium sp. TMG7-5b_MA50 TaxID=3121290 RepID=UPI003221DF3F